MPAQIINGRYYAQQILDDCTVQIADIAKKHKTVPCLAAILIGENSASKTYVTNKVRTCAKIGMRSKVYELPASIQQQELLALIQTLNTDKDTHGILIQLPLPPHINKNAVIAAIRPGKDVDGFHAFNTAYLYLGQSQGFVPCTPKGCLYLLKKIHADLAGLHAAIIGRSNLVGKPLFHLLLQHNCTVTLLHSGSKNPHLLASQADLLISATGQPNLVDKRWIKPGATVLDVGINRLQKENEKTVLCGDVNFQEASQIAGFITPVPGGVGPMTIACLMQNCIQAFRSS